MKDLRKYVAEFIGTFVLVLVACGTAVVTGCVTGIPNGNVAAYLTTAGAFGLVIVAMAYSIGNISGCHINPAVSLAMLISKKMNVKDFICYVVAQVLGAIAAAAILNAMFHATGANALAAVTTPAGEVAIKPWQGFLVEAILTCIFVLAILGVTSREKFSKVAGLVIGGTLTLVHLLGIAITGTSVNPARSLGPAIFAGGDAMKQIWIFILAPFAGAIVAALVWMFLDKEEKKEAPKAQQKSKKK